MLLSRSDDHDVVGGVLLEALDQLLLALDQLGLLPRLHDQPDLLLDELSELLHRAWVQVPGHKGFKLRGTDWLD